MKHNNSMIQIDSEVDIEYLRGMLEETRRGLDEMGFAEQRALLLNENTNLEGIDIFYDDHLYFDR